MIGLMVAHSVFFCNDIVLVLFRVGAVLENGYGIQGQNYVAKFQRSGRNLILGI